MKLESTLMETDSRHSDLVDSMAYAIASQMAKLREEYILMHLRKCPWWLPEFVYKWIIKKIVVISYFKT